MGFLKSANQYGLVMTLYSDFCPSTSNLVCLLSIGQCPSHSRGRKGLTDVALELVGGCRAYVKLIDLLLRFTNHGIPEGLVVLQLLVLTILAFFHQGAHQGEDHQ